MKLAVVLLALFAVAAHATICNSGQNVLSNGSYIRYAIGSYWNAACTNPTSPYCSSTATVSAQCNQCDHERTNEYWSICDCPANQYCDPDSSAPTYGTCVGFPFPGKSATCSVPTDCPINIYCPSNPNGCVAGYWSCVGGYCSPCNQTFYGNATIACPGGSPYPLSSRQGETRTCNAAGTWIGGGAIVVPSPSPQTASPASPSTSGATTKPRTSLLLFAATAALVTLGRLGL